MVLTIYLLLERSNILLTSNIEYFHYRFNADNELIDTVLERSNRQAYVGFPSYDTNNIASVIEGMIKQIPQIDFTLGIGDIVGSIALVSAFTFYISHTQASQSEQIKTSRDLWAVINERVEYYKTEDAASINPVLRELDYFAYLILHGEIRDKMVIGYYQNQLIHLIQYFIPRWDRTYDRTRPEFPNLNKLIDKWDIKLF